MADDRSALARAESVVALLDAAAGRIEAAREMPADVLAALHEARLFRLLLPKSLGGDALDLRSHVAVMETVAAGDASAAWVMGQGAGCALAAAFLAPEAARRWFGAPDAVLAWGAGIQGKAVRVEGGYRVTGKWTFASGSRHATALGGHSYVVDAAGAPVLRPNGEPLDRTVLIRREDADIDDVWQVMGLKGTGSDTFAVADIFVAEADTIDRENAEELRASDPLFLFPGTVVYGLGFAALQIGIARAMLELLRDLALTKTPRGVTVSLRENPVFQMALAKLEARLRSARAYLRQTAGDAYDAVAASGRITLDDRAACKLASVHVIHECMDITAEAYRQAGSSAIVSGGPFERRLRDAFTASQQTQARAQNFVTLGRMLLDLEPESMTFL